MPFQTKRKRVVIVCLFCILSGPHTARFCLRFPMIIYDSLRYPRQSCSARDSMIRHAAITPDFRRS